MKNTIKLDPILSFGKRLHEGKVARRLAESIRETRPVDPIGRVLICCANNSAFAGPNKVKPESFFPGFCRVLHSYNIDIEFISGQQSLSEATASDDNTIVIDIYNEEADHGFLPRTDQGLYGRAALVFNHRDAGAVMSDKARTNGVLTAAGVPMPRMDPEAGLVFRNTASHSSSKDRDIEVSPKVDSARGDSYETEYIDTAREYLGRKYLTSIRMLCVGEVIISAFAAARPAEEGKYSVKGINTPVDIDLIRFFQERLIHERHEDLQGIAKRVAKALGPGFYAHDLVVDSTSGEILLCEAGYKFSMYPVAERFRSIAKKISSDYLILDETECARASAEAFVRAIET